MSGRVRVVRVEKNGVGPFQTLTRSDEKLWDAMWNHIIYGIHLKCTVDMSGVDADDYLFACESEEDLYEYFGDQAMNRMLETGYSIRYYSVMEKNILYGRGELAFLISDLEKKPKITQFTKMGIDM